MKCHTHRPETPRVHIVPLTPRANPKQAKEYETVNYINNVRGRDGSASRGDSPLGYEWKTYLYPTQGFNYCKREKCCDKIRSLFDIMHTTSDMM